MPIAKIPLPISRQRDFVLNIQAYPPICLGMYISLNAISEIRYVYASLVIIEDVCKNVLVNESLFIEIFNQFQSSVNLI